MIFLKTQLMSLNVITLENRVVPRNLGSLPAPVHADLTQWSKGAYSVINRTTASGAVSSAHADFVEGWKRRWQTSPALAEPHRKDVKQALHSSHFGRRHMDQLVRSAWYASSYQMLTQDFSSATVRLFKPVRMRQPLVRTMHPKRGTLSKDNTPNRDFVWEVWSHRSELQKIEYWPLLKQLLDHISLDAYGDSDYLIHCDRRSGEVSFRIPTPNLMEPRDNLSDRSACRRLKSVYYSNLAPNENFVDHADKQEWPIAFPIDPMPEIHGYQDVPGIISAIHDIWHKIRFMHAPLAAQVLSRGALQASLFATQNPDQFQRPSQAALSGGLETFRELRDVSEMDSFYQKISDLVGEIMRPFTVESLQDALAFIYLTLFFVGHSTEAATLPRKDIKEFFTRLKGTAELVEARLHITLMDQERMHA